MWKWNTACGNNQWVKEETWNYVEMGENEGTTYWSSWDTAKAPCTGCMWVFISVLPFTWFTFLAVSPARTEGPLWARHAAGLWDTGDPYTVTPRGDQLGRWNTWTDDPRRLSAYTGAPLGKVGRWVLLFWSVTIWVLSFILLSSSFLFLSRAPFPGSLTSAFCPYTLLFIRPIPGDLFCGLSTVNDGILTTGIWVVTLPLQAPSPADECSGDGL